MKKMRLVLAVLVSLFLIAGMIGCGSKKEEPISSQSKTETTQVKSPSQVTLDFWNNLKDGKTKEVKALLTQNFITSWEKQQGKNIDEILAKSSKDKDMQGATFEITKELTEKNTSQVNYSIILSNGDKQNMVCSLVKENDGWKIDKMENDSQQPTSDSNSTSNQSSSSTDNTQNYSQTETQSQEPYYISNFNWVGVDENKVIKSYKGADLATNPQPDAHFTFDLNLKETVLINVATITNVDFNKKTGWHWDSVGSSWPGSSTAVIYAQGNLLKRKNGEDIKLEPGKYSYDMWLANVDGFDFSNKKYQLSLVVTTQDGNNISLEAETLSK